MPPLQISHNEESSNAADWRLQRLKIVLVAPKGEQNVGAVARVCANFEVRALVLQKPYQRMSVCLSSAAFGRDCPIPRPASCDV
jgi:tRNA G18 (ribose-2'-O)-methylase SpoU